MHTYLTCASSFPRMSITTCVFAVDVGVLSRNVQWGSNPREERGVNPFLCGSKVTHACVCWRGSPHEASCLWQPPFSRLHQRDGMRSYREVSANRGEGLSKGGGGSDFVASLVSEHMAGKQCSGCTTPGVHSPLCRHPLYLIRQYSVPFIISSPLYLNTPLFKYACRFDTCAPTRGETRWWVWRKAPRVNTRSYSDQKICAITCKWDGYNIKLYLVIGTTCTPPNMPLPWLLGVTKRWTRYKNIEPLFCYNGV